MSVYIIAQLIGFIGYSIYIAGPYFQNRRHVLGMDMLACAILMVQWALLSQPMLVFSNIIAMNSAIVALSQIEQTRKDFIFCGLYLALLIGFICFSHGHPIDIFALSAGLCSITARASAHDLSFRGWSGAAGALLVAAGGLACSLPAVLFNLAFTSGHIQKICKALLLNKKIPYRGFVESYKTCRIGYFFRKKYDLAGLLETKTL